MDLPLHRGRTRKNCGTISLCRSLPRGRNSFALLTGKVAAPLVLFIILAVTIPPLGATCPASAILLQGQTASESTKSTSASQIAKPSASESAPASISVSGQPFQRILDMFPSAYTSSPIDSNHRHETKNSAAPLTPPMTPVVSPEPSGFAEGVSFPALTPPGATPLSIDPDIAFSSSEGAQGFLATIDSMTPQISGGTPAATMGTASDIYFTPVRNGEGAQETETPLSEATLLQIQYAAFTPEVPAMQRESKGAAQSAHHPDLSFMSTPLDGFSTPPVLGSHGENGMSPTALTGTTPQGRPPVQIDDLARDLFNAGIAPRNSNVPGFEGT